MKCDICNRKEGLIVGANGERIGTINKLHTLTKTHYNLCQLCDGVFDDIMVMVAKGKVMTAQKLFTALLEEREKNE